MRFSRLRFLFLLTAFVGIFSQANAQIVPADSTTNALDTVKVVPTDSLSADSLYNLSTDSAYTTTTQVAQKQGFLDANVHYTAEDSIRGEIFRNVVHLYNEAYVEYEQISLKAGYIRIDFDKNQLYAEGIKDSTGKVVQHPIFTESGKSYRADNMRYDFDSKKAKIKKVITQEGEGFLHGEEVKRTSDEVFYIKNAAFTTCSHTHPHFQIRTPKAKVISGDKIVTKWAFLEILDVPTPLAVPFGFFPTTQKRKSGIIMPSYGSSQYRGYYLRNGGFYWAGTEYFDLAVTGDIYTQGGYAIRTQSNYAKRYKYRGSIGVNFNKIKFGQPEFATYVPASYNDQSDYSIQWSHSQDAKANPDFRFSSNVNFQSTNYNKVTSLNVEQQLQNVITSSISMSKQFTGKPYSLTVSANHSQNNQTKALTLKLPQFNFSVNRLQPFKRKTRVGKSKWYEEIGTSWTLNGQNEIRTRADKPLFTESVFTDSARMGLQHSIPLSANYKIFKFIVFNPSINYNGRVYRTRLNYFYNDSLQRIDSEREEGLFYNQDFSTSASFSTKLYGQFNYRGYVQAIRHVMTPNIGFSYKPDFSESGYGYFQEVQSDSLGNTVLRNRYSNGVYGSASQGLSQSVNFGLQNTLEAKIKSKDDSTGVKKIKLLERLSLNTSYNAAADEFKWSNLSLTASSRAFNGLVNINYRSSFDFYGFDPDSTTNGQRVNISAWEQNGKLLRMQNQGFTLGFSLNQKTFGKNKKEDKKEEPVEDEDVGLVDGQPDPGSGLGITDGDVDYYNQQGFVDFSLPWNVNFNYNLTDSRSGLNRTIRQSADVSGDIRLTENWRIGFRTGYDFEAKDFTNTSLDFYRDLHCWELRCTWIPFGFQQSYTLTLRVKASMLQDLKLERRRGGLGDTSTF